MGWVTRLELAIFRVTAECFNQLSDTHHRYKIGKMVEVAGFKPTATCTPSKCSIRLSYTSMKGGDDVGTRNPENSFAESHPS